MHASKRWKEHHVFICSQMMSVSDMVYLLVPTNLSCSFHLYAFLALIYKDSKTRHFYTPPPYFVTLFSLHITAS